MKLEAQWDAIEHALPDDWEAVHLRLKPELGDDLPTVAATLGPMGVGRVGDELALVVRRAGGAAGPEAVGRLFRALDERRVWCALRQGATSLAVPQESAPRRSLAHEWDAAISEQPSDWSDLLCRLRLASSDLLDRAALLCAPINPSRDGEESAFRFRAARRAGYGVSPTMARRCFERLDAEGIEGSVEILTQLAELDLIGTQGAVL